MGEEALLPLDDGLLTRRMVSKRCWMFLMNQRASCSRCCSAWLPSPLCWPRRALA
jgi:hypothetical protein